MILIMDVQYGETNWAAGLVYDNWESAAPSNRVRVDCGVVEEYEPGEFYRRELPALLQVVGLLRPTVLVIDGYVHLPHKPGLGAHLHAATGLPVLGIAKKRFEGVPDSWGVLRGESQKPLFVSAIGIDNPKEIVRRLPGRYRIPEWVQSVDRFARHGVVV